MSDIHTYNDFMMSSNGTSVINLLPLRIETKQQAYRTAAWIKLMGEMLDDEDPATSYEDVETAIANT
jgi:hypothetical protein